MHWKFSVPGPSLACEIHFLYCLFGSQDSSFEEHWTCDGKVVSLNPGRRIFFSEVCVLTLIWCPFNPCVTAMARKRPQSFCQKCRWQVTPKHAYTLDLLKSEWADYAAIQAECGNLSGNELTRNSSGNTRLQSSQLAEPL